MKNDRIISSKVLSEMEVTEPLWYIDELLPEGVSLLVAKPKVGKSALLLYFMVNIALGQTIWDKFKTTPTKMLYLPFDDPMRRFRSRLHSLCEAMEVSDISLNDNLSIYDKEHLERMEVAGNMEDKFSEFKDAGHKLIVVDTLNQGVQFGNFERNVYKNDYLNMSKLKEISEKLGLSIILTHHEKKGEKVGSIDAASGSAGIPAAVDTIFRLTENDFKQCKTLEVTGKDVESKSYNLKMENDTFRWSLLDIANSLSQSISLSPLQQSILKSLKANDAEIGSREIANLLDKEQSIISQSLRKLEHKGLVISPRYGYWKEKASHE